MRHSSLIRELRLCRRARAAQPARQLRDTRVRRRARAGGLGWYAWHAGADAQTAHGSGSDEAQKARDGKGRHHFFFASLFGFCFQ